MEKKQQIDIKEKGKLFYLNLRNGVKIYLKKDELLKFSKSLKFYNNFNEIIDKTNDSQYFAKINYLIYNDDTLKGYSMKFYQDAKTLKQLFNKSFMLKKDDCLKIQNAFDFMTENDLYYNDIYRNNFMITKDEKILVVDLESLENNELFDLEYFNKKKAAVLALSYLYGIEVNEIGALLKNQSLFLEKNNEKLFNYFYNLDKNSDINDLLKLVSLEDVKVNRRKLKIESQELHGNQYFKKYYY